MDTARDAGVVGLKNLKVISSSNLKLKENKKKSDEGRKTGPYIPSNKPLNDVSILE